ncbi:Predicted metal-dependent hydrolase of the TIM-barrel fold [Bordetella hinzii]|uniref:amidohydrolase family protein n=1 Tax=Bordetella hinzii TaxID=103855 RepID=UPI000428AE3C|nr:amidohydrolase family protein [Bordetella hinzii]AKQ53936.1 Amidohydrolase [Bordetella hinzii]KCB25848.1 amidohydrolase family protein [Bordetella hinzii L60]SNV98073.1 Predicted metal-dependent hydrolase of the TIM-barrel fold [Bordetella hinzii]
MTPPGDPRTAEEDVLEPGQPIVDAHHHLYERPGIRYLLDELLADLRAGHDVRATVYVQARSRLRQDGEARFRPVGETAFANGVACASESYGAIRACAAIVGAADLCLGDAVRPVLEAHIAAAGGPADSGGRFRGIRHVAAWDPDPSLLNPAYPTREDLLDQAGFRRGFSHLAPLGLSFDAWLYFHQLPRLTALARAFPGTRIILNHCGGILGQGRYAGRQADVFRQWRTALGELASCPNVTVKLGGLGMPQTGLVPGECDSMPLSARLAAAWRPWIETCIEVFGSPRCMFESNFPADRASHGYAAGWNAFKRLAMAASPAEKADLFWRSACACYRLPPLA